MKRILVATFLAATATAAMLAHQKPLLESELHRFVRFTWEAVNEIARRR